MISRMRRLQPGASFNREVNIIIEIYILILSVPTMHDSVNYALSK